MKLISIISILLLYGVEIFGQRAMPLHQNWQLNGKFFYVVDTIHVDSALRITFYENNHLSCDIYIFNKSVKQVDSLLTMTKYTYNKFLNNGYAIGEHTSIVSMFSNSFQDRHIGPDTKYVLNTFDKYRHADSCWVYSLTSSKEQEVRKYIGNNSTTTILYNKSKCFIIGLINTKYYHDAVNTNINFEDGDMKFIRIAFPVDCSCINLRP